MDWAKARRGGRRRGNHCTSCVICRWPRWHPPCGATHTKLEAMVSSCKWLMRWPPIERLERGEGTGAQVLQTNSLFTTPYRVGHASWKSRRTNAATRHGERGAAARPVRVRRPGRETRFLVSMLLLAMA
jgi:hypothetical protein